MNDGFFTPSLLTQRRHLAANKIETRSIAKLIDMGCSEGSLLELLLNDTRYSDLAGIDCDEEALNIAKQNCSPMRNDFDFLRELPITLNLYKGNLVQCDERLTNFDCISCLEGLLIFIVVIEHLDSETLAKFPESIFGYYNPKLVIISTPNAEFNIHFSELSYGGRNSKFRHEDHKFEWTRKEFQNVCG
jgi:2-polyprenyl-3-methyl-5-hydroxy-6-metoxy-1,4-benzoquinol methylase